MVSASLTSGPVYGVGASLSTYSGRTMWAGTGRRGEMVAGAIGVTRSSVVSRLQGMSRYATAHTYDVRRARHERREVLVLPHPPRRRGRGRLPQPGPARPLRHRGGGLARAREGRGTQRG